MSTRAIIAATIDQQPVPPKDAPPKGFFAKLFRLRQAPPFRGVYLHNAGGPSDVGPILFNMVHARHGGDVAAAVRELVDENPAGWSSLAFFADAAFARAWDGKTKITVDQNQEYFNRGEFPPGPSSFQGDPLRDLGFRTPPVGAGTDKMGAVYVYLMAPSELVLYVVGENGVSVQEFARVPWRPESPDWDAVDGAAEEAFQAMG